MLSVFRIKTLFYSHCKTRLAARVSREAHRAAGAVSINQYVTYWPDAGWTLTWALIEPDIVRIKGLICDRITSERNQPSGDVEQPKLRLYSGRCFSGLVIHWCRARFPPALQAKGLSLLTTAVSMYLALMDWNEIRGLRGDAGSNDAALPPE